MAKLKKNGQPRAATVPMAKFIEIHQNAATKADAVRESGLEPGSYDQRLMNYRAKGIALKQFPRGGGATLDVEAANALVAQFSGQSIDEVKAAGERQVKAVAERAAKRAAEKATETASA